MNTLSKFSLSVFILVIATLFFSFTDIEKKVKTEWKGIASYYHPKFNGRKTANGEIFSNTKFTAANNFLRLGTLVKITNPVTGISVVVKINDRMNKNNNRLIDLSQAAAQKLGLIQQGVGEVIMEIIDFEDGINNLNSLLVTR